MDIELIDVLTSKLQYVPRNPPKHCVYLGLDTEMLIYRDGKILWPDDTKLPQERKPQNTQTSDGGGKFDFHGDGFATELCIRPDTCLESMLGNVSAGFYWWNYKYNGSTFKAPSVYTVPKIVADAASDTVKRLGCMPSFNIYGDPGNPESLKDNQRTTGCHLHMSHPKLKDEGIAKSLVKWADILVGCTWTYISPEPTEVERERRTAYGRAGEFRLKDYGSNYVGASDWSSGVEYRVLPGVVLHHPAYFTLMFSLYRSALDAAVNYGNPDESISLMAKDGINNADKALTSKVLRHVPFTEASMKLLKYLHRRELSVNTMLEWNDIGQHGRGHVYYANNEMEVSDVNRQ